MGFGAISHSAALKSDVNPRTAHNSICIRMCYWVFDRRASSFGSQGAQKHGHVSGAGFVPNKLHDEVAGEICIKLSMNSQSRGIPAKSDDQWDQQPSAPHES